MSATGTTLERSWPTGSTHGNRRGVAIVVCGEVSDSAFDTLRELVAAHDGAVEVVVAGPTPPLMTALYLADAHLCVVPEGAIDLSAWACNEEHRARALLLQTLARLARLGVGATGSASAASGRCVLRAVVDRPVPPLTVVVVGGRRLVRFAGVSRRARQRSVEVRVIAR